jgi:hypothetical protein
MKITRPTKTRTRVFIYSLIILIAIILITGTLYWLKARSEQNTTQDGPTPAQQKQMKETDNKAKESFIEDTKGVDNPGVTVPIPSSPDTIELRASKTSASTVTVFTKLKGYASGVCDLTVTNGAKTHIASAPILYQPEYSICAGFDVPIAELATGSWTVKLVATPESGDPVTKSITLEVK